MATLNQNQSNASDISVTNKLQPETLHKIPLKSIVRGENIREAKKAKDTSDIENSIRVTGLQVPLTVNTDGVLLDGYRRLNVLETLEKEADSTEDYLVSVIVKDIPSEQIPLFQYQTMQRVGIGDRERSQAILAHVNKNQSATDKEVAILFSVDATTVAKALRIHKTSPALSEMVLDKKITQNAALEIVESVAGSKKDITKMPTAQRAKVASKVNEITNYLAQEIEANESATKDTPEKEKVSKPWDLKKVNKVLIALDKKPITVPETIKEPKPAPVKRQALSYLDKVMDSFVFSPSDDADILAVSGSISKKLWSEISSFISANYESTDNLVKEERSIDDLLDYYEKASDDGEVFIQDSETTFVTFNSGISTSFPSLKLIVSIENSLELVRLTDGEQLQRVIKKLNSKGIDTLCVRQTRFNKSQPPLKTLVKKNIPLVTTTQEELENIPDENNSPIEQSSTTEVLETTEATENNLLPDVTLTEEAKVDENETLTTEVSGDDTDTKYSKEEIEARVDIGLLAPEISQNSTVESLEFQPETAAKPTKVSKKNSSSKTNNVKPNYEALAKSDKTLLDEYEDNDLMDDEETGDILPM